MDFEQRVSELLKQAMKAGDKTRLQAVRAVKSTLQTERTKTGGELPEDRALEALATHRKKMANAIEQYRESGREDLAASAEAEIAVCDELLPKRADEEEIAAIVDEVIASTGASGPSELGKVMGPVMGRLKGRADGTVVRRIVGSRLGGQE
jgi:uncharacterized protein YqeY